VTEEPEAGAPVDSPPPAAVRAGGRGWGVRETRPRQLDPWDVPAQPEPPTFAPGAYVPPAPAPTQPAALVHTLLPTPIRIPPQPPSPSPSPSRPQPTPPPPGFPTNKQVAAIGIAAAVVVAGIGVSLFRGHSAVTPPVVAAPPGGAVAVVHSGPAMLVTVSLTGGSAGRSIALPGSPTTMVTTHDGTKAFLLDTTHGEVIPVDLVQGRALTPIPVGKLPIDEDLSPDGTTLYVIDNLAGTLIPIDTASNIPRPAQQVGQGLASFTKSPSGPTAVIAAYSSPGQPGVLVFYNTTTGAAAGVVVGRNTPTNVVYTPEGATVWVTEEGVGNQPGVVVPIDARTHAVGAPIAVGHSPAGAAMSPDGHTLVVTNTIDRSLTIVDLTRRAAVATVAVGAGPTRVEISADGTTAWVANVLDRSLLSVDLRSHRSGATVALTTSPSDLTLPKAGGRAWVLFQSTAGNVRFLTAHNTFGRTLQIGNGPNVVVNADSTTAWAINTLSDSVQRIDVNGESVGPAVHVARAPGEAVLTPDHRTLLVLSFGDGTQRGSLTPVDTQTLKAGTPLLVGVAPAGLTLAPDGGTAYIYNHQTNSLTVVDLRLWRVHADIQLPCSPTQIVLTPDGTALFANCNASSAVIPVKTNDLSLGPPILVAPNPRLVMSNQGKVVIVMTSGGLQEIDPGTNKVVLSHAETGNIVGIVATPDDNTLIAIENTGGAVLMLHTATLVTDSSIAVGTRPGDLQLTPNGSRAYVLDSATQKLYVIDVLAGKLAASIDVTPNAESVVVPSHQ